MSGALFLIGQAAWQHFYPPFTDAQLAAVGIVDTWEPRAIVVSLLLVLLAIAACVLTWALVFGAAPPRRRCGLALTATVVAGRRNRLPTLSSLTRYRALRVKPSVACLACSRFCGLTIP